MNNWKEYASLLKELNTFVKALDESVRAQAFSFLLSRATGLGATPATPAPLKLESGKIVDAGAREVAPQELIKKSGYTTVTDKAILLAYWLEIHQGQPSFTRLDLQGAFAKAREPAPTNTSDVIARLLKAGKLMEAGAPEKIQAYKLTSTGIAYVEACLSGSNK